MIDSSVLRGVCKKCEESIIFGEVHDTHFYKKGFLRDKLDRICKHEPIWCLSAQQMLTIINSKEFNDYLKEGKEMEKYEDVLYEDNKATSLATFLSDDPFLVAKILKEAQK